MRKIKTLFVRDLSRQPALITPEYTPGLENTRDSPDRVIHA